MAAGEYYLPDVVNIAAAEGRDAVVIYPPVDTDFYTPPNTPREDFYLVVSALAPYKRFDLAIEACRKLGKKLVVITNSEWHYTQAMMRFAFDRYVPKGQDWRSLFDLVIVGARKPSFFTERMPAFEVLDEEGRLFPASGKLQPGKAYLGGNARLLESSLGIPGEQFLYIGDHIFADVNVSKSVNRWRTGLVLRDLERELDAQAADARRAWLKQSLNAELRDSGLLIARVDLAALS